VKEKRIRAESAPPEKKPMTENKRGISKKSRDSARRERYSIERSRTIKGKAEGNGICKIATSGVKSWMVRKKRRTASHLGPYLSCRGKATRRDWRGRKGGVGRGGSYLSRPKESGWVRN